MVTPWGMLVAPSENKSGMLLNILQCTGQSPPQRRHSSEELPGPNFDGAEVEKAALKVYRTKKASVLSPSGFYWGQNWPNDHFQRIHNVSRRV